MTTWWGETPAGLLARDRGFPGDAELADRLDRAEAEHRHVRAEWEAQMDAVDHRLAAEGRLELPWRARRAEAAQLAEERSQRGNWVYIEHVVPKELAALHVQTAMRQVRMGTSTPGGNDATWASMARAHADQVDAARRLAGPDVNDTLPPSSRVF